jgi:glucosamine-6-phosphate deaminase
VSSFKPTTEKPLFVIAMPSGDTALGIYECLASLHASGQVSFAHVACFNLDEYVGIPRDHPRSQHTFMWTNLFSKVDIKRENVYFLDGNAGCIEVMDVISLLSRRT